MRGFALVAAIHFLALLSPGPDFVLIVRVSIGKGWRSAAPVCAGIAAGNGLLAGVALLGVGTIDPASDGFRVVQAAGAGFLVFLGWRLLGSANSLAATDSEDEAAGGQGNSSTKLGAFAMGLGSALLNPKNLLFYASLAAMLPPETTVVWKLMLWGWMVTLVFGWDLLIASLIGAQGFRRRLGRAIPWVERGCALLLIGLGGWVLAALAFVR